MEYNNKKLERTSKFVNYFIAIVLCAFLILLSSKVLDDMDDWSERPYAENFMDREGEQTNKNKIKTIQIALDSKNKQYDQIEQNIAQESKRYNEEKQSFDNWLAARKIVGSTSQDKAVLERANALDAITNTIQNWREKQLEVEAEINKHRNEIIDIQNQIDVLRTAGYERHETALRSYNLKVFLLRLLIIAPLLLLAVYFILRFRKHKFWPLFLGYILFSFYAFFVGLVPYLPSYGGYIRYTVGIIITVLLGIYALNKIRSFINKKKEELKEDTRERSKKVQLETAEKALSQHMCPSCGKDFVFKSYDHSSANAKGPVALVSNFCRYCGLELFNACNSCGTENFVHLPFCSSCGADIGTKAESSQVS